VGTARVVTEFESVVAELERVLQGCAASAAECVDRVAGLQRLLNTVEVVQVRWSRGNTGRDARR